MILYDFVYNTVGSLADKDSMGSFLSRLFALTCSNKPLYISEKNS